MKKKQLPDNELSECTKSFETHGNTEHVRFGSITLLKRIKFENFDLNKAKIKTIIGRDPFTRMKCCILLNVKQLRFTQTDINVH